MPHVLRTMLIAILITLPLANCGRAQEDQAPSDPSAVETGIMTGQRAPDFTLTDLSGKAFTLSELRDKKPVLLIFWATWCPACLQAIPYFSDIHKQYAPRGLEIISINIASNDPQRLSALYAVQQHYRLYYQTLQI